VGLEVKPDFDLDFFVFIDDKELLTTCLLKVYLSLNPNCS
jgi:hypothetical protein